MKKYNADGEITTVIGLLLFLSLLPLIFPNLKLKL